jgi:hypothetical protein
MNRIRLWLVALCLVLAAGPLPGTEPATAPTDLQRELARLDPPWYDRDQDSWKRIAIRDEPVAKTRSQSADDTGVGTVWTSLVAWLLLTAVIVALAMLIREILRDVQGGGTARTSEPGTNPARRPVDLSALPFTVDESADPDAEAEAAFARGDWHRAVVWTYVRLLIRLDAADIIRLGPGATDRGCLRQAQSATRAGRPNQTAIALERTLTVFERTYFGHQAPDREAAVQVRHDLAAAEAALAEEAR